MPHCTLDSFNRGVAGQQLQRQKVQSPQRQMANAIQIVVQSLADALGKYRFVVDRQVPICS